MSLARRLFAVHVAVAVLVAAVAGGLLYDTVTEEARGAIESRLVTEIGMLAAALGQSGAPATEPALDHYVDAIAPAARARITIVAPGGRVLADSEFDGPALAALDDHGGRAEVRGAFIEEQGRSVRYSRSVRAEMLYRTQRIEAGPWAGGVARMGVPLTRVAAARREAALELLLALAVALALAVGAAAFSARRVTRPIRALREAAQRVRAGDLAARARVRTGDELEELAESLAAATDRLAGRIAAATAERDRLEGVLEAMAEGVIVTDAVGRAALANAALARLFGISGPVEGRTPLEVLRHAEAADALAEAAAGSSSVARDLRVPWPSERVLALHAVGLPGGGAVGVFHDVTERRRLDRVRRDFVANVSHELRTPLATVAGHAEELADPALDLDGARRAGEVIRRHAARMEALVGDLLELARIEADGFAPRREPIDAGELLAEVAREWEPRAVPAPIRVEAPPDLAVHADRRLLRQALDNLVDNAIAYGDRRGEVRLGARVVPGGVELSVADQGPGIPHEDQPRIFERFYRVEKGRSREGGGTGLGLSIVRHVAEAHGGRAEVDSRPGAGAVFRIFLPLPSRSARGAFVPEPRALS